MSLKGLNVTHLVSRTACWVVIAGPHPSTAPPPRASRWSTAWRTPRTCGRSDRHQTEDGMNLETMIVYVLDDWRTDGRPTGRRWRRRSQTSDPTLWWSGTIPPGRVSNCDKAGTGGGERWQWWNMLQTGWSAMFPPVFLKPWRSQRWSLHSATLPTFFARASAVWAVFFCFAASKLAFLQKDWGGD